MGEIVKLNDTDRPHIVALISAIEKAIDDIAPENMAAIEVLGVLDYVSKRVYEDNLTQLVIE